MQATKTISAQQVLKVLKSLSLPPTVSQGKACVNECRTKRLAAYEATTLYLINSIKHTQAKCAKVQSYLCNHNVSARGLKVTRCCT